MRLRLCLDNPEGTRLPINYQEWLTATVYSLLAASDTAYARHLHDEGYLTEDGRRFKLFTFSWLRGSRRTVEGDTLRFAPGPVEWQIASPVEDFVRHLATGLLSAGVLRVGPALLPITQIELPQVCRRVGLIGQESRDFIVGNMRLQKPRKARGGGRAERRDQVIGVKIEQRLVHSRILPDEDHLLKLQQRNAATMSA